MLCFAMLKIIHLHKHIQYLISRQNLRWHLLKQHAISRLLVCQTIANNHLGTNSKHFVFDFLLPNIDAYAYIRSVYVVRFDLRIIIAMILKLASFIAGWLAEMNIAALLSAHFADSESCLFIYSENSFLFKNILFYSFVCYSLHSFIFLFMH